MKNRIYIIVCGLIVFCCERHFSQTNQDLPFLTGFIILDNGNRGSGLWMADSNDVYFLTAQHNIFNRNREGKYYELKSSGMEIFFRGEGVEKSGTDIIAINLRESLTEGNILRDSINDICALYIGRQENRGIKTPKSVSAKTNITNISVTAYDMAIEMKNVFLGQEIWLLGYPSSIGLSTHPQYDRSQPLITNGIVSGKYEALGTYVINCSVYPGNSGGPVFAIKKVVEAKPGKLEWNVKRYLIGLAIELIPWNERINLKMKDIDNTSYSVVMSIEPILDRIQYHTYSF